jgi:hypothetical protein
MLAARELVPVFAATLNETVPLPEPDPEVIVIQPESLAALHEQPLWVLTEKLPGPPDDPKD